VSASDLLRAKFHSDRQLALYAQHGFDSTLQASRQVASDIYAGLERVSWYSACLIPRYHEVCTELFSEDKRMLLSIKSIYRYRDVILILIELYLTSIIDDYNNGNEKNKIQHAVMTATGTLAQYTTGKGTRLALAMTASKAIAESGFVSSTISLRLSKKLPTFIAALQAIGFEQHCAMAARRLKSLDAKYYALLYTLELEMLYYYVEPIILKMVKSIISHYGIPVEELLEIIKREFNV